MLHPYFREDVSGCSVLGMVVSEDAMESKHVESEVDQQARRLSRDSFAPSVGADAVADIANLSIGI